MAAFAPHDTDGTRAAEHKLYPEVSLQGNISQKIKNNPESDRQSKRTKPTFAILCPSVGWPSLSLAAHLQQKGASVPASCPTHACREQVTEQTPEPGGRGAVF